MIDQDGCSPFDHCEHLIKSILTAPVGIGNVESLPIRIEFAKEPNLGAMAPCRIQAANVREVLSIHCQNQIEGLEIACGELPGAKGVQGVSAPRRGLPHPAIGRLPDMPGARAGRIHIDPTFESMLHKQPPKYTFGRGTSTDIAQTDE